MKQILFNAEMVREILGGRKSVTRRVVRPQPPCELRKMTEGYHAGEWHLYCDDPMIDPVTKSPWGAQYIPRYSLGDILYVRETWSVRPYETPGGMAGQYIYKADGTKTDRWFPSIHMPREAARLFLRVIDVRVERLQDIAPEQIDAEGCKEYGSSAEAGEFSFSGPSWFRVLWDNTVKLEDLHRYGWEANPWVWVISFERITKEEALAT